MLGKGLWCDGDVAHLQFLPCEKWFGPTLIYADKTIASTGHYTVHAVLTGGEALQCRPDFPGFGQSHVPRSRRGGIASLYKAADTEWYLLDQCCAEGVWLECDSQG